MDVYENLKKLNLSLPSSPQDSDFFTITRPFGDKLIYVSGCGSSINGEDSPKGQIPSRVSLEEGKACARNCALNIISALQEVVGDLNKIKSIVKLLVYVSSEPNFTEQHLVAHGASGVFIDVFGPEIGKSTRSAVGVAALPLDFPVEVEAILELKE